ncbi:hypothetical protein A4X13_0g9456 [Tilletia indica]|uniref:Ubiquitin-like protease family profile domain-containing protein n=1 Tax=Tilletia indica TaxID=43049 RepID=A0A177SXA6_9BASI|nr:hypothetical protein A4X13_0g9456 [Tilletia indica]
MASLAPKTFVNDNVVHFGMRYLLTAPRPLRDKASPRRARWDQIRVMDSLWFTKIQTAWEATPRDDTWFSKKKSRPNLIMDSRWFTKIQTAWEASPRDDTWFSTKFTKNIDVFERPYLVIPINDTQHFYSTHQRRRTRQLLLQTRPSIRARV